STFSSITLIEYGRRASAKPRCSSAGRLKIVYLRPPTLSVVRAPKLSLVMVQAGSFRENRASGAASGGVGRGSGFKIAWRFDLRQGAVRILPGIRRGNTLG